MKERTLQKIFASVAFAGGMTIFGAGLVDHTTIPDEDIQKAQDCVQTQNCDREDLQMTANTLERQKRDFAATSAGLSLSLLSVMGYYGRKKKNSPGL
ncbi:MAG: hypothetical protein ACQEQL_00960 [Pseudomonadota bacterium]